MPKRYTVFSVMILLLLASAFSAQAASLPLSITAATVGGSHSVVSADTFSGPCDPLLGEPCSAMLAATVSCSGPDLVVDILGGDAPFAIDDSEGNLAGEVPCGTYLFAGPATWTGLVVSELGGDFESLNLGDITCPAADGAVYYPNVGEIRIGAGGPVTPYAAPDQYPQPFTLPADYDGNGFDTYIVTVTAIVDEVTWYAVWIGGDDYLWVPAALVQVLR